MKRLLGCIMIAAVGLGSLGCVSQAEYDSLLTTYRKTQEQVVELRAQLEEAEARLAAQEAQGSRNRDMAMELEAAIAERDRLREALAEAEQQLRDLGEQPQSEVVVLDPETDSRLKELAADNPELMTYDSALGMVKLRSDLTFALGSAEVNPDAERSLGQLADVVNRGAASQYALRIVGHTDNVPIRNPATKEKHPTNWHLSVHRAISVRDVLDQAGVDAERTYVAGYGQYQPIVPNPERGGAAANRRVEIFLKPMTQMAAPQESDAAPARSAPTRPEADDETPAEGSVIPAEEQPEQPEMFK
ncbi:MAG: OmpA family protein [Phycisphaeraceae bacterium]